MKTISPYYAKTKLSLDQGGCTGQTKKGLARSF